MDCNPPGSSVYRDSPVKNTGLGCRTFLQGIFPTQGSNPTLQADSLSYEPPGKPKNTGVGSLSLLQGNFLTQELNGVSCIAGRFFTSWATREALISKYEWSNVSSQKKLTGNSTKDEFIHIHGLSQQVENSITAEENT